MWLLAVTVLLQAFLSCLPVSIVRAEPGETNETQLPEDIAKFPVSYQSALLALKQKHPTWTFEPIETGRDWNTAVSKEMQGNKSLVYKSFPEYDKEGLYGQSRYFASRGILEY